LRRFSVIAFRRRVLIGSPPALERRLIASPCAKDKAIVAGQTSTLEVAGCEFKRARPANSLAAFAQSGLFRSERRRGLIFWSPQYQELENPAALS
jgi:hypothetical protein